ncbi:Guanylate cyclase [Scophthalmus maximus]|uniref:Guanylate cyclase n=1 Tax=Scophthalmus maximus TaxID=52904 RepID=A0A2U9B084_SCOMX|nr:Guanylate cyclase [Scophthalmus maximus]
MKTEQRLWFLLALCVCCIGPTCCWHDLDNSEYDCWPLDRPNEYNMIDCGGETSIHVLYLSRYDAVF